MKKINILIVCLFLGFVNASAQDVLTKEEAVKIALKNNYDIQIIKNSVEVAKNNTSIINGGYLPTLSADASARHNINTGKSELQNGTINEVTKAESDRYSASLGLGYNNVNLYGLINNLKKIKQQFNLSELQAKSVMENTLQTLFFAYYEVARLTDDFKIQKQNLEISNKRFERVKLNFDYGQSTKLDVLNAEVDFNKDQITLLNSKRDLENSKRDLNIVLGRDVNTPVNVVSGVDYIFGLEKNTLIQKSKSNNTQYLQLQKSIELSEFDVKISKSGWMPNVSLTSSYAWSRNNNDNTSFQVYSQNRGLNYGVGLSWSIFDGGNSINKVRNAKISLESKEIEKEQGLANIEKNVSNSWQNYQNLLAVLDVQKTSLEINKLNFSRSEEYYKFGQINSIEYRQAQLNLLTAELNLNSAKYNTKNAELELLRLSGDLLENKNF
jgi:outer membrane protein TolC